MSERLNLMSPEVHADPYPFYAELRRSAPACQVDPGGVWAISRYRDITTLLKDPSNFSSNAWVQRVQPPWLKYNPLADALFVLDPPEHTQMRNLVNPALGAAAVEKLEPQMRVVAAELTRGLLGRSDVEFVSEFSMPMAASGVGTVLGLPPALYPRFKHWTASIFSVSANKHSAEQISKILSDIDEMQGYFGKHIETLRKSPSDGLVSELLRATVDGRSLTDKEMMSFMFILLPGGLETMSTVLGDTMVMLAKFPDVLERVRANRDLIPKLINEVMRYEGTAHTVFRTVKRDVEIAGTRIPAGAMVVCLLASGNRDDRVFEHADEFDIDRDNNHLHLSFGYGVHHCVGVHLGRMATRVALETLLPHVEEAKIGPAGFQRHHSLNARGPVTLPLLLRTSGAAQVAAS